MPSPHVILLISIATIPFAWAASAEIQVQPDRIVPSENKSLSVACRLPWQEVSPKDFVSVLKIELVKSTAETEPNNATSEPEVLLATVRIDGTEATLNVENDRERYLAEGSIDPGNLSASFLQLNISQADETDAGTYACVFSLLTLTFVMAKERVEANVTLAATDGELPDLMAELWEKEEASEVRQNAVQAQLELMEEKIEELSSKDRLLEEKMEELSSKDRLLEEKMEELSSKDRLLEERIEELSRRVDRLLNDTHSLSQAVDSSKSRDQMVEKLLQRLGGATEPGPQPLIEAASAPEPVPSGQAGDQSDRDRPPAAPPTVSSGRRQCFACGNPAAKRPCNGTELKDKNPVTCPAGKDYCMNVIFQTETSNAIYKGCVSEEQCKQETNAASDACKNFVIVSAESRECHFCCSSDGCNSPFKPSVDLVVPPA